MIYRKKKGLVTREIAGETLIVPLHGNLADMQRIFTLDAVAAFIWEHLDGEHDLDTICEDVTARFETENRDVAGDAGRFIEELLGAGLIEAA